MQHGPTSTRPVQVSLTVEREEGLAVERRPQAQRLGSWCTVCIPTVGTSLVTQTKNRRTRLSTTSTSPAFMILVYSCILTVGKSLITQTEEGLAAYRRPKAQRFGSWCTVASFKLARVSSSRQRKGLPRINAHTHKKMEVRQPLLPYSLVFRLRLPRSAQRSGLRRSLRADSRRNLHVALHARARSAVPSLRPQYMGLLQTVVHIGQTLQSSISWVQSRSLSVTSRT